jgi:hypothetical protein
VATDQLVGLLPAFVVPLSMLLKVSRCHIGERSSAALRSFIGCRVLAARHGKHCFGSERPRIG